MGEKNVSLAVDLGGVRMQNPVNTASGTFGFGQQFEGFFDVARLGAITLKGCSAEPWPGNPAPRMCEVPSGMMNTVGLANPGVRGMAETYGAYLAGLEGRGLSRHRAGGRPLRGGSTWPPSSSSRSSARGRAAWR